MAIAYCVTRGCVIWCKQGLPPSYNEGTGLEAVASVPDSDVVAPVPITAISSAPAPAFASTTNFTATKMHVESIVPAWIAAFSVGEQVLVNGCGEFRRIRQKGVVDKVNKTSVTVNLFRYTEIRDQGALRNQTHGIDRLIWSDTFDAKKAVKSRKNIIKKGESVYSDVEFVEGRNFVDYGY